jgi:hypothetical protein
MYDPLLRLSREFVFKKAKDHVWHAIDGADNLAGKIYKKQHVFEVHWQSPSLRSLNLDLDFSFIGFYTNLNDAKQILILHDKCKTKPVFAPGKIVGWIDKSEKIKLSTLENPSGFNIINFIKKIFTFN